MLSFEDTKIVQTILNLKSLKLATKWPIGLSGETGQMRSCLDLNDRSNPVPLGRLHASRQWGASERLCFKAALSTLKRHIFDSTTKHTGHTECLHILGYIRKPKGQRFSTSSQRPTLISAVGTYSRLNTRTDAFLRSILPNRKNLPSTRCVPHRQFKGSCSDNILPS